MTLATSKNKEIYVGNGSTTVWPITFRYLDEDHLKVYLTAPSGAPALLSSGYYIDNENSRVLYPCYAPGAAPDPSEQPPVLPNGWKITILREVPLIQETDLTIGGGFRPGVLENAYDYGMMASQQLLEALNRSVRLPVDASPGSSDEVLSDIMNYVKDAESSAADALESANAAADSEDMAAQIAAAVGATVAGNYLSTLKLADIVTKGPWVDVRAFGAVGDGIANDTAAITSALAFCATNNRTLFFPNGTYLDSAQRIVTCNIIGQSRTNCTWKYTGGDGTFITIPQVYSKYASLDDITLVNSDTAKNVTGIKVEYQNSGAVTWGGSLRCSRANLKKFTNIGIHLRDAFGCYFDDCVIEGAIVNGVCVSKLLVLEAVNSFPNCNTFNKTLFISGKIGIQALGCTDVTYYGCLFENITLLLNTEKRTYEPKIKFYRCWFEALGSPAIVNAKLADNAITPYAPVTNKVPLAYIMYDNCWQANVATPLVDATVNPNYEGVLYTYSLVNGATAIASAIITAGSAVKKVSYTSTNNPDESPSAVHEISHLFDAATMLTESEINGITLANPIPVMVSVTAWMQGGNPVYANFMSILHIGSKKMTFTMLGTAYDQNNLGADYKIKIDRDTSANNFKFIVSAKGANAYALNYIVTLHKTNM